MDDEAAAEEAVRNLNGTSVKGRSIKVEKSESKGPRKPSQKLFVGNLAEGTLFIIYYKVLTVVGIYYYNIACTVN